MATDDGELKNPVRTAQTTFSVLEALKELEGATLTELSDRLDMPKSSTHNYLQTLEHEGYVVSDGRTYRVGLRFLDLGGFARTRRQLYHVARPEIKTLVEETGELVNLLVEESGRGIFLLREEGADAVNVDSFVGECIALHTTALGKTILAHLPGDRVAEIVDRHGLPAKTEQTITNRGELSEELDRIRERGVAFDEEERIRGLCCVAVPIRNDDRIRGAISVSGPTSRLGPDRNRNKIADELQRTANIIELNLTYS